MVVAFKFSSNSKIVNAKMSNMVARQMPFAISHALNQTGKNLIARNKRDMRKLFDRPVAFTLNAFYFKFARKYENSIKIRRKEYQAGKHYLEIQDEGGVRPQKAMEKAFVINLPTSAYFQHVLPTNNTPRNKHGNMTPGFRTKIMSAMQVMNDPLQNSKVRGRPNKGNQEYFVPGPDHPLGQGKKMGVYQKYKSGRIRKVLNFVSTSISYRPKLRFHERMNSYAAYKYPRQIQKSLRHALSTAKLR